MDAYTTGFRKDPLILLSSKSRLPSEASLQKKNITLKKAGTVVEACSTEPTVQELDAVLRRTVPVAMIKREAPEVLDKRSSEGCRSRVTLTTPTPGGAQYQGAAPPGMVPAGRCRVPVNVAAAAARAQKVHLRHCPDRSQSPPRKYAGLDG
eukprot:TRINITY_DN49629_c0_g1_i1.p1 TRINITY_DN49629_c0_g1~~TRINITY_DN49629_c0_g1_i1.p1  ORF type:complete len:151 (+),score=29.04 TRINITY_DN49629_c0_g1_i1:81-533(+)